MRRPWQKHPSDKKRKTGRAGVADRQRIKFRDKFTCQICGVVTDQLEIDHIVPLCKGGTDEDSNKRALCIPCHESKSQKERGVRVRRHGCDVNGIPYDRD